MYMGIKIGSYVPPVYKGVKPATKPKKTREERIEEHKNLSKAIRAYTGSSIDVRI
jgi:hypothetical protein